MTPRYCIAIDPGPLESALIVWDGRNVDAMRFGPNDDIIRSLYAWRASIPKAPLAIEMIGHYGTGMPAGKEVFDTCVWIGRFTEAYGAGDVTQILRATVKAHICGSARAKDANIRQAIIDRFGGKAKAIGRKAAPGVLYGVSSHLWAALAVAITFWDTRMEKAA